ncbi:MAG: phage head closure protein [Candidatus Choladocola sp.]|nr:phage head closure protein [Candidatus Choladocola sp.]
MISHGSRDTFEAFNDGIVYICYIDSKGNAGNKKENIRFQERTVGSARYYEAMTNKVKIDRLIRIPFRSWMTTEYLAVIDGQVYEIVQVQTITDTKPKSNNVSLRLMRQRRISNGSV